MAKEDTKKKGEKEEAEEKQPNDDAEEGGDAEGEEGAEAGEGGKKKIKPLSKKKKIILMASAGLLVILIVVMAALYFTGHLKKKSAVEAELAAETGDAGKGASKAVFYDMEEFLVNLNVGSKRPSFLKMSVSLEVVNELQIPIIEKNMPRVRDNFQAYLRELRQEDLQGSAGLYRLREELLLRVNKVVYPAKVNDILFKEILVQ